MIVVHKLFCFPSPYIILFYREVDPLQFCTHSFYTNLIPFLTFIPDFSSLFLGICNFFVLFLL